ncbi:MAG: porin [Dysgonomonas sp.]|nr:porin [Dysgonomonas sp.]
MKKVLFSFLFFFSLHAGLYAQDGNNELLKKLVEKEILTESEAEEIRKESASSKDAPVTFEEKVNKVRDAFNTPYMRFGGYGLFMYRYSDVSDIKHKLDARVIFLSMRGNLTNNLEYFILAEVIDPTVHEFWAQWTPAKEFSFRAGQFKVPISMENQLSLTTLETIFNTRSVSSLIAMGDDVMRKQNGRNNGGRDIGIQAAGSLISLADRDLLEYGVGLFQGSGIVSSELNNTKDFAGSLNIQPVKGFRVGGGLYLGKATYMMNDEGGTPIEDHVRNRWLVSTDYQSDRLYCRAEWIRGKDGDIDREGLYGMAQYYLLPKKLNAVAKVDYYNKDKNINQEVMDYTAAVNYYFFPDCRLQLNYTYSDYSNKWGEKNSHNIAAQMQIVF